MSLVKLKQRVADHGEVFTPEWMVEAMLDLVKGESERIDSRFLEPACGDGNFLVQILRRKLAAVELKYGKSDFERRHKRRGQVFHYRTKKNLTPSCSIRVVRYGVMSATPGK